METVVSPVKIFEIPLEKILPNPENPRGDVLPDTAQAMAESLREAGQKTEIRVRPLTEAERQAHPGSDYLLIGGHVRLEGAKLAGLSTLRAVVVEGTTPGQELLDAVLDNRWEEMGWWQWDLAIEKLLKAENAPTQRQLAAQLGWHESKLSRVMKVMEALNPAARELVGQNLSAQDSNPDEKLAPRKSKNKGFSVTESILLVLADLGDPQEVEKALRRVLDHQMTESQVKTLVAWVKSGRDLESYHNSPSTPPLSKGEKSKVHPATATSTANKQPEIPTPQSAPIGAGARDDGKGGEGTQPAQETPSTSSQIGAAITGNILWKQVRQAPGQIANRVFPRFVRIFHWTNTFFQKRGIKNPTIATFLTAFLLLWAFSFLIHHATSMIGRALLHLSSGPQAGRQALVVPSQGADGNGGTTGGSVKMSYAPYTETRPVPIYVGQIPNTQPAIRQKPAGAPVLQSKKEINKVNSPKPVVESPQGEMEQGITIPAELKDGVEKDSRLALSFAGDFYGVDYRQIPVWEGFIKNALVDGYYNLVMSLFYPPSKIEEIQGKKLVYFFKAADPVKVVAIHSGSEDFQVEGVVTVKSDLKRVGEVVSQVPATLVLSVAHSDDGNGRISRVRQPNAAPAPASAKGQGDLGKNIGDGVHDLSDAVNTADTADTAVEKGKNLLGF